MEREDNETSEISCEDLTVAGALFGETGTDNTLTYSADSEAYLKIAPGTYVVTIEGQAVNSSPTKSLESTYTFTLVDPCDPPNFVEPTNLDDQVYTITDTDATYMHPAF